MRSSLNEFEIRNGYGQYLAHSTSFSNRVVQTNEQQKSMGNKSSKNSNTRKTAVAPITSAKGSDKPAKVLVLFYSTYGHNYIMAQAVAEGVQQVSGVQVDIKRIPETLPDDILEKMYALDAQKQFAHVPVAQASDIANYDAFIFGLPTRFGSIPAQVQTFLDTLGQVWYTNGAVGKVASAWVSTASQHAGHEATLRNMHNAFLHLGMIVVGLPASCATQIGIEELKGGTPYGAGTITGQTGERMPSANEKEMARFQGKHVATIAKKLTCSM